MPTITFRAGASRIPLPFNHTQENMPRESSDRVSIRPESREPRSLLEKLRTKDVTREFAPEDDSPSSQTPKSSQVIR
jgi:hypothetical protein